LEKRAGLGLNNQGVSKEAGTLIDGRGVLIFWCSTYNAGARRFRREGAVDVRKDEQMGGGWAICDYGGGWTGTNCDSRANEAQRVLAQPK